MTIREMCEAFDVTPRALRFYESKELLFPARIGQKRLYSRRDRARLKLILRGKSFGFSLEDIRRILALYNRDDSRQAQLELARQVAQKRRADILDERAKLDASLAALDDHIAFLDTELAQDRHSDAA